ncbi:MAG: ABC transporter ATP-binding protein, partial [Acidimicrobiia bacterium]|nr:ABC transporter ATP-binding protein [Acidimicrobiia bacterium]
MTLVAVAQSAAIDNATSVVAATGAAKVFDTGDGISGLDLEVPRGTILGLIGPSGSGKTTAVRLMTGVLEPTSGELEVLGMTPQKFDASTRQRLGYMPQRSVLYPNLSVAENLDFFASLYGRQWRNPEALSGALDFVELTGHESKRVADISGGMKRRLALAATLIHSPELIFLD